MSEVNGREIKKMDVGCGKSDFISHRTSHIIWLKKLNKNLSLMITLSNLHLTGSKQSNLLPFVLKELLLPAVLNQAYRRP